MVFANIEYLFLLLLLIPYIVWYIMKRRNNEATLQISDARVYAHTPKSYKNYLLHVPFMLRIIALASRTASSTAALSSSVLSGGDILKSASRAKSFSSVNVK